MPLAMSLNLLARSLGHNRGWKKEPVLTGR